MLTQKIATFLVNIRNKLFKEECIECIVCCNQVPLKSIICCFVPVDKKDILTSELAVFDNFEFEHVLNKGEKEVGETRIEEKSDPQIHPFCRDCILGLAKAAVGEIPLAKGGIGLRCMMTGCDNPILYSEIYKLLPKNIQNKLEERMFEESVGMALLVNLERCKNCNFAIQMEVDKKTNKVFDCPGCKAQFCRLCERDWDDEHIGFSCQEVEQKIKNAKRIKKEREIEKKINEAVVRKCPRCGVQFVKEKGCNHVTCRCGMTQCYLCRQTEIKHDHFCQHYRDPNSQNCDQCNKKCLLYEDANKIDQQIIIEIREKGETSVRFTTPTSPNRKSNIASNTSSAATTNSTSSNTDVIFIKILEGIIIGGLVINVAIWGSIIYHCFC
uniref:RING-type domain-containing protein n=1 Tax=Meloidogyne incognita TaxID=6306 RepID=A0A914KZI8_MELIC